MIITNRTKDVSNRSENQQVLINTLMETSQ